jgi:F-type H+-transporting ATPase subunit b
MKSTDLRMSRMVQASVVSALLVLPSVAFAAGGESAAVPWNTLIASIINFAVYIGIIVYFAGPKIQAAMRARRDSLMSSIDSATARRRAAEEALAASTKRLSGLAAEREALLAEAREIGARDAARLVEAAQAQATKIAADARISADAASRRLARELEAQLVARAMVLAREDVARRMSPTAHARLLDAGIQAIVSSAQSPQA